MLPSFILYLMLSWLPATVRRHRAFRIADGASDNCPA